ncbi:beta-ribofuranosylaminobenzene 5'-phosphate synthase family protein [Pikeienuella sp. HZG-20]|uniref:beta-ribofuranosylaminobenzene 5'-phosphate synthase family protein n=1 Tax=Paludibacillus litoralis TaxID=3133267 RepID=UPI0030EF488C
MKIEIRIPSRLHFALCDLRPASVYGNGGIGLGIDAPHLEVSCTTGHGQVGLHGKATEQEGEVIALIKRLKAFVNVDTLDIEVVSHLPAHSGFGSHTALALGIVEAVGLLSQSNWNERQIIELSGRGGTSGVGIQTYFHGGLAYDFGRPGVVPEELLPSSVSSPWVGPIFGPRVEFPDYWEVLLAIPNGNHVYGQKEVEFFEEHTPLEELDALRAIASIHHGVIPAVASADLVALATSLRRVHLSGFKMLELKYQSQDVRQMYGALVEKNIASGLSSFGPLIYSIVDVDDREAKDYFEIVASAHSAHIFNPTIASRGRLVSIL